MKQNGILLTAGSGIPWIWIGLSSVTIPSVKFVCQCETIGCVFGSWDQTSTDDFFTWISGSLCASSPPLINFFKWTSLRFGMYRVRTTMRFADVGGTFRRMVRQFGIVRWISRIWSRTTLRYEDVREQRPIVLNSLTINRLLETQDTSDIGTSTETLRFSFQSPNSIPFSAAASFRTCSPTMNFFRWSVRSSSLLISPVSLFLN